MLEWTHFQDEIKSAIQQIVNILRKPILAIRSSLEHVKVEMAKIINKIKKGMATIKETVMGLGENLTF